MTSELDIIFSHHSAKQVHMSMNGMTVLKQLVLSVTIKKTRNILHSDMFPFGLQNQDFLVKCLSEATTDCSAAKIRQMAKVGN